MVKACFLILTMMMSAPVPPTEGFKTEQKRFSRVRQAYAHAESTLLADLEKQSLAMGSKVFLRAIKDEQVLEMFVFDQISKQYKLFKSYPFCSTSGEIGPKRQQGDLQIPEGLYHIDRFNPHSYFYLSLGINYPNKSDKIRKEGSDSGGDIFIHGDCVTIGCIPITDAKIEEVYVLAVEAKNAGQSSIPVHFFPSRLTTEGLGNLKAKYPTKSKHYELWDELSNVYQAFEKTNTLPKVRIDEKGVYLLGN